MAREPFEKESDEVKISIVLKWIMQQEPCADILSGKEVIKNIVAYLDKMNYNGYLRLFDIDLNLLKTYMTSISWSLLQDYASKHKNDLWVCPHCKLIFKGNDVKWRCERCLFWYHENCAQPKKLTGQDGSYILCFTCLFGL